MAVSLLEMTFTSSKNVGIIQMSAHLCFAWSVLTKPKWFDIAVEKAYYNQINIGVLDKDIS